MSLDVLSEVWDGLKTHIDLNERPDAAETLVNMLVDLGYETDDIKEAFRSDKDVIKALQYYDDDAGQEYTYGDDFEPGDSDEDW